MESKNFKSIDFNSWLVGFIDGEGCFCVSFNKKSKIITGIEVRASFSVSQKHSSLKALEYIQSHFKCGGIRYSKKDGTYKYEVRNFLDLKRVIIPFFKTYPLLTKKAIDFNIFEYICLLIGEGSHLNKSGLEQIIDKAYQMNGSGKRKYSKSDLLKFIGKLKV